MITVYGIPNCDTVKKARTWLGWVPRIGVAASIARSAAWYQAQGWL